MILRQTWLQYNSISLQASISTMQLLENFVDLTMFSIY